MASQVDKLNHSDANPLRSQQGDGGLRAMNFQRAEILGKTLPEVFYRRALKNAETEFYFTKRRGHWESMTYAKALDFVLRTMEGLKRLGFERGQKAVIFSENREEWMLTDYAIQWMGGATAAIYITSTPDQIKYILNESDGVVLFLSNESMLRKLDGLTGINSLKAIVAWDDCANRSCPNGVKFVAREEFLQRPMDAAEMEMRLAKVRPEDLAILLYTSGTTGEPKGVMISHQNLVSNLEMFVESMPLESGKNTISFLPLSHIYERSIHHLMVAIGLKVYFAESMDKLLENIAEVRPQVMTAVPRIFEKMYAKIHERIKGAPWLRRQIFYAAQKVGKKSFEFKYRNLPLPTSLRILNEVFDQLVFKKIRAITGGRAEIFISGGAPISVEIVEFFFRAGFTILEGYGLSETCILCVNRVDRFKFGSVGLPFSKTEIKIAEDGEICAKGPQVMKGYYKRDDATAEVFDSEGWFHTGDIGEIDADGFLRITDRKKELIITAGGKKVAPQPIENALKKDSLIESVCIVGDRRKYVSALIVPNLEVCRSWGEGRGLKFETHRDCVQNAALHQRFRGVLDELNKTLPQFSTIKDFRMVDQPFTIETGELTPTLKLKRRVIEAKHEALIASMYVD